LFYYLRFRRVGPHGWGTTVFFVVYLLLTAIALYFRPRTEFHSPVAMRGDWRDRVGAFWLVGCVFGPLLGWIVTSGTFPITQNSWRWMYGARVFLAAVVPILLAMPLTRYVRGKSALIALPLLVVVTLLPVSTAMNVSMDLWEGPVVRQDGSSELYLKHTGRRRCAKLSEQQPHYGTKP
jgi:MFS family permease